MIIDLKQAN